MSTRSSRRSWRRGLLDHSVLVAALLAVASLLVGCGSAASPSPTPSVAEPVISDAWIRAPMGPDRPAAGYLVISNPGTTLDTLVGAKSPAAVKVEVHETTSDASGMTGMQPIDRLEIPAGGTVTLEPGGYHLMLMEPSDTIVAGATVELTLVFEHAGEVTLTVEVRAG